MRRKLFLLACSLSTLLILLASGAATASAHGPMPSNQAGTDISWPQCGGDYPGGYSWAVIGVTGGLPFTANPCFQGEYDWAYRWSLPTQLYINLQYGQSASGPLTCLDADPSCQAYNYGWKAAADAYNLAARETLGSSTVRVSTWWLDVETGNDWSDDVGLNSYVIQGAIDYLERMQGRTVGVYSTAYQWSEIAGAYAPPDVPNWVAGGDGLGDWGKCSRPLWPGGVVWAFQSLNWDIDLDEDLTC